jgi:hypothetical protein
MTEMITAIEVNMDKLAEIEARHQDGNDEALDTAWLIGEVKRLQEENRHLRLGLEDLLTIKRPAAPAPEESTADPAARNWSAEDENSLLIYP